MQFLSRGGQNILLKEKQYMTFNNFEFETAEEIKEAVFHSYFDKRVIDYPVSKNGQSVGTYLDFREKRLASHFESLKLKYGFKKNWEDLQSEYVYQAWLAINKFKVDGETDEQIKEIWLQILNGENEHEENKLIKYIKNTVGWKIYEFANPNAFRTTTTKNGKKVHYTLIMEMESLDGLLADSFEEGSQPLQLTDENMLFDNEMFEYYISFFQKWFDERKAEILTEKQIEFLNNLKKLSNDIYLTAEEFEEVTDVRWANYSRWLRRIESRILKAWREENPTKKSRKQVHNTAKIEYFEEYMRIVECEENLMTQNLELTDYLVKGMKDKTVEYDVFLVTNEAFKGKDLIEFNRIVNSNNFNRVALSSKLLYMVTDVIEQRLEKFKEEQARVETETPAPKKIRPKNKHRELITYDKNGEVIKHEYLLEQDSIKHKNIFYILPTGAQTQDRNF